MSMQSFYKWIYEKSFELWDWCGKKMYAGKLRKNYKFRVEYQHGVKKGRQNERVRIISILTWHRKEFKNMTDVITFIKNLP